MHTCCRLVVRCLLGFGIVFDGLAGACSRAFSTPARAWRRWFNARGFRGGIDGSGRRAVRRCSFWWSFSARGDSHTVVDSIWDRSRRLMLRNSSAVRLRGWLGGA